MILGGEIQETSKEARPRPSARGEPQVRQAMRRATRRTTRGAPAAQVILRRVEELEKIENSDNPISAALGM